MNHQPLETQKYLVDRSRDPKFRRLNRKRWAPHQIRRVCKRLVVVSALLIGGLVFIGGRDSGSHQNGAWLQVVRALKSMVGELNQHDKVMNAI